MGSRAFGELLLRPSTFTRITTTSRLAPAWSAQRSISSTLPRPSKNAAAQQNPSTATTPEIAASSPAPTSRNAASQAIDDLFASPSPSTTTPDASSSSSPNGPNPGTRVFGAEFSNPRRVARRPNLQFDNMMMPDDSLLNPSLANKPTTSSLAAQQTATFENYPRLDASYGRTVELDTARGRDIVRGIGMLGSLMARNKVKQDFQKQRFHERGGLKRKRLNSERWRARFKKGFQEVTGRVMELTRKGW